MSDYHQTPLPIVAHISRVVTKIIDQITGDRSDYPYLVAAACSRALNRYKIENHILYGRAAWLEVLENYTVNWAGYWDQIPYFWVETEYKETVDLTVSVAFKKRTQSKLKAIYSPPILWSNEIPLLYRFQIDGAASLAFENDPEKKWWNLISHQIDLNCNPEQTNQENFEFLDEPIILSGKKLLDDSKNTFKHFDRVISVIKIPAPPF